MTDLPPGGDPGDQGPLPSVAEVAGLARLTGVVAWRAVSSLTRATVGTVQGMIDDVLAGEPVTHVVDDRLGQVQATVLHTLGLQNGAPHAAAPGRRPRQAPPERDLRSIGNAMLTGSWRTDNVPHTEHPAFATMLASLTSDEARILRFLAVAGAQPVIDVRTRAPFGVGSELIASGINMIAEMAGCTLPERDQHYLVNLDRLGLVHFSAEPVNDRRRYALLEAQPKATEPMERVPRATTAYRRIALTPFGRQFCELCFELEGYDAGGWADDDRGDRLIHLWPRRRVRRS